MASQDPGSPSQTGKPAALRRTGSGRMVTSKADQADSSERIQEIADIANHVVSKLPPHIFLCSHVLLSDNNLNIATLKQT